MEKNTDIAALDLFRRSDGRLAVREKKENGETEEIAVQAMSAFPWSRPLEYISIRDDKGREKALIEHIDRADENTRKLIIEELAGRNFMPKITAIESITPEMELFHWKVTTSAGPRSFLTGRHEYPRQLPGGKVLIKDVGNDLYIIENPKSFDPRSLKLLWVYLD
jgi:hypothetical protein